MKSEVVKQEVQRGGGAGGGGAEGGGLCLTMDLLSGRVGGLKWL